MPASENQIVIYQPNETIRLDGLLEDKMDRHVANHDARLTALEDKGGREAPGEYSARCGGIGHWQHWN